MIETIGKKQHGKIDGYIRSSKISVIISSIVFVMIAIGFSCSGNPELVLIGVLFGLFMVGMLLFIYYSQRNNYLKLKEKSYYVIGTKFIFKDEEVIGYNNRMKKMYLGILLVGIIVFLLFGSLMLFAITQTSPVDYDELYEINATYKCADYSYDNDLLIEIEESGRVYRILSFYVDVLDVQFMSDDLQPGDTIKLYVDEGHQRDGVFIHDVYYFEGSNIYMDYDLMMRGYISNVMVLYILLACAIILLMGSLISIIYYAKKFNKQLPKEKYDLTPILRESTLNDYKGIYIETYSPKWANYLIMILIGFCVLMILLNTIFSRTDGIVLINVSFILMVIFLTVSLLSLLKHKNIIDGSYLIIKRALKTKKIHTDEISRLTTSNNGKIIFNHQNKPIGVLSSRLTNMKELIEELERRDIITDTQYML